MINPNYLIILDEDGADVFEEGYGTQSASVVAAVTYRTDVEIPHSEEHGLKAQGSHGTIYIPDGAVTDIVDISEVRTEA